MNTDKTKGTSPFVINHPRVVTSLAHPRQVLAQTCSRLRNSSRLAIVSIAKLALTKARPLALPGPLPRRNHSVEKSSPSPQPSPPGEGEQSVVSELSHRLVSSAAAP
jgi:hypothetical protein